MPNTAFALGDGIKLWDVVTVRPIFKLQEQYDGNVFLDEKDEKPDFITTFDAGADVEFRTGDIYFTGGYLFDMNLFTEHEDQNSYNHNLIGLIDWKLTDYQVLLKDEYRRFATRAGTEDTSRISRQNNKLSLDILTELNRLAFDFGYDFVIEDYLSDEIITAGKTYDEAEDRVEHTVRGEVSHRFLPKTSLLAEADAGLVEYDGIVNADSYFIQALAGLKGEVLNSSVDFKVGFRHQEYDKAGDKDFSNAVAIGNITKNFGKKDTITLNVERSAYESTYKSLNYYILNHIGLDYVHQFNNKLSTNLAGSYQISLYPKATTEGKAAGKRYDNYYRARCSLQYDIQKWFSTELAYEYIQRESRFANFDFINNLVTVSGLLTF